VLWHGPRGMVHRAVSGLGLGKRERFVRSESAAATAKSSWGIWGSSCFENRGSWQRYGGLSSKRAGAPSIRPVGVTILRHIETIISGQIDLAYIGHGLEVLSLLPR